MQGEAMWTRECVGGTVWWYRADVDSFGFFRLLSILILPRESLSLMQPIPPALSYLSLFIRTEC